jgi:hypothetical protein
VEVSVTAPNVFLANICPVGATAGVVLLFHMPASWIVPEKQLAPSKVAIAVTLI